MAWYYLETSALVKLYVREPGTDQVLLLAARSADNNLAVLSLSQLEFRSAIRRRERTGEIPARVATQLLGTFQRHGESRFVVQPVTDSVVRTAATLIDRYTLRAFDAIQLAGCSAIRESGATEVPTFVCSDRRLLDAAKLEGFATLNPAE